MLHDWVRHRRKRGKQSRWARGLLRRPPGGDFAGLQPLEWRVLMSASPVAADDAFAIEPDTLTVLPILANDSDPDGDMLRPLSTAIQSGPSHGVIFFDFIGQIVYEPDAGFEGVDTFTYTVEDSTGAVSNLATVTITVGDPQPEPEPEPPVLEDVVWELPGGKRHAKVTLRLSGDVLELLSDRDGGVVHSQALSTMGSLTITGGHVKQRMSLSVDLSGGSIELGGGLHVDAMARWRVDRLIVRGTDGADAFHVDGGVVTANGLAIHTGGVERLDLLPGLGDDHVSFTGSIGFGFIRSRDIGGNDTYELATTGIDAEPLHRWRFWLGQVRVRDLGGDDTYDITASAGRYDVRDDRGADTFDFSGADDEPRLKWRGGKLASVGLGDATIHVKGHIENVVGADFDLDRDRRHRRRCWWW